MSRSWLRQIARYGIAIGVVVFCTLLRISLDPVLGNEAPFTLYFAGVMFVAWLSGPGPSLVAIALCSAAGSYFFCEPRGSLWIHDLGHQISLVLFIVVEIYIVYLADALARDIARRKLVESALRQSEEKIRNHQAELTHAARLNNLGELAAGLAHELNQPLYAVNNYADGCLRRLRKIGEQDADLADALRQITSEANRAVEIVRRVRTFAQKRGFRATEHSVLYLVEESVSMSQSEITKRQAEVTCNISPQLPAVLVDPIQVEQVLINLVLNALDSMDDAPPAERRVTISARSVDTSAVEVVVSDRGKGIAADAFTQVFEPFFTTKPEGMGLGLAISRSIIEAHGGRIWADANADCGTCVHFTLPIFGKE